MATKQSGVLQIYLKNFKRGLNKLVNATQIRDDELQEATNCLLADEGSVTKRWGSGYFGNAGSNTGVYGIYPYYKQDGTKQLLALEGGFLKRYNTTTSNWDLVTGASFSSGITTDGVLLTDKLYLSNGIDNLTKYDGSSLSVFTAISAPASNWATLGGSLASGQYIYSYRITATNSIGETLASIGATISSSVERETWNPDANSLIAGRSVTVNWNKSTGATGYNIYGVIGANETYLDHVDGNSVVSWVDYGTKLPSQVFSVPSGNTTSAPKGKYAIEFKSSLLLADPTNPSRVHYSAGVDKPESFLISDGGGYIDVSKNGEDGDITGLAAYQNQCIVFKERSIWSMDFNEGALPSLKTISQGMGCVSNYSIVNVENDLFFVGQKIGGGAAIYVLGNEPNYLNMLRTNELSARVRPIMQSINRSNFNRIRATYYDSKYIVFFTNGSGGYNNYAVTYDRERLGFTEWDSPNVSFIVPYYDNNGYEWLIFADPSDNRISYFDDSLTTDKGSIIGWKYRTKELNLDEPYINKAFRWVHARFRDTNGQVQINIYKDSTYNLFRDDIILDNTRLSTSFGASKFGSGKFGRTVSENTTTQYDILRRRIPVMRIGHDAIGYSISLEVVGEQSNSKATLLDAQFTIKPKAKNKFDRNEIIHI